MAMWNSETAVVYFQQSGSSVLGPCLNPSGTEIWKCQHSEYEPAADARSKYTSRWWLLDKYRWYKEPTVENFVKKPVPSAPLNACGLLCRFLFEIKVLYEDNNCVRLVVLEKKNMCPAVYAVELGMEYVSDTVFFWRENLQTIFASSWHRQHTVRVMMAAPFHFTVIQLPVTSFTALCLPSKDSIISCTEVYRQSCTSGFTSKSPSSPSY